jgi:hypothetical protein
MAPADLIRTAAPGKCHEWDQCISGGTDVLFQNERGLQKMVSADCARMFGVVDDDLRSGGW